MANRDLNSYRLDSSRNFPNIRAEIKFICAALTISIKPRLAFTNIRSVGVRAGSIHVTRVISFTFFNIWETIYIYIYIFAFYPVCNFKNGGRGGKGDSQSCNYFNNYKRWKFSSLCVSRIKYLQCIFHQEYFNLSSWRLQNNWLVSAASVV